MTSRNIKSTRELSRRQVLQTCGVAVASLGLGTSLPASTPYERKRSQQINNLIWIQVNGGLSQLDTFDPKPEAPQGTRTVTGIVKTFLPGTCFGETMGQLAGHAHKLTIVRSYQTLNADHNL